MSQQLLNFLRQFAGIPSYDRRIAELELSMAGGVAVSQAQFTRRNNAQDAAIASKEDASGGYARVIWHIGGPLANDDNNGLTPQTPFATLQKVFESMDYHADNILDFHGNVILDEAIRLPHKPYSLQMRGSGDVRQLIFQDAGRIIANASSELIATNIRWISDKDDANSTYRESSGGRLSFVNCEFDITPKSLGAGIRGLFELSVFTNFYRINAIDTNRAQGRIINDILPADTATRFAFAGA